MDKTLTVAGVCSNLSYILYNYILYNYILVVMFTSVLKECLQKAWAVLQSLQAMVVIANPSKFWLDKVKVLVESRVLETKRQLKVFLGVVSYY